MSRLQGAIAATRFGMGAAPGEISAAASDPRGWLNAQVKPDSAILPAGQLLSARQILQARQRLRASAGNGGQGERPTSWKGPQQIAALDTPGPVP